MSANGFLQRVTAKTLPAQYRKEGGEVNFPEIDTSHLDEETRARFNRLQKGIRVYIRSGKLHDAAQEAGNKSHTEILRLFRRCLTLRNGAILGWSALIPYVRVSAYVRTGPIALSGSLAGAFQQLLDAKPAIRDALIAAIQGQIKKGATNTDLEGGVITISKVYRRFEQACHLAGLTENDYPLCTDNRGYRSVANFCHKYLDSNPSFIGRWHGLNALKRLRMGTGKHKLLDLADRPFDVVAMDAHQIDVIATLRLETRFGVRFVPVRRLWVIVVRDVFSQAVLGYSISHSAQVTEEDVARALLCAQTQWTPRKLRRGLCYVRGAGLPCGRINGLPSCPIVALRMDNGSAHYADAVNEATRGVLGISLMYGPKRDWATNPDLERFNKDIARRIHELSGSMGSGPQDENRSDNPVRDAVANEVEWEDVHDVVEQYLTAQNAVRGQSRGNMTPLEVLEHYLNPNGMDMFARVAAPAHFLSPRLGWDYNRLKVAGNRETGHRPHFQHYGRKFTSSQLMKRFDLIGTWVSVHIRRSDFHVEAHFADGASMGEIVSTGKSYEPCPLATARELYNRGKNKPNARTEMPFEEFTKELADSIAPDLEDRPYHLNEHASKLAENLNRARDMSVMPAPAAAVPRSKPDLRDANRSRSAPMPIPMVPTAMVIKFGQLKRQTR